MAVVEIVTAQNHEIETLKTRCERLESNDQALMVAFTTFFHILSASGVSTRDSLANVFGNIIDQAKGSTSRTIPSPCSDRLKQCFACSRDPAEPRRAED